MLESVIRYAVERGGVGSVFGLIMCLVSYKLWERNNALQDARSRLVDQAAEALAERAQEREMILKALDRIDKRLEACGCRDS
jgi:hypothetical protein